VFHGCCGLRDVAIFVDALGGPVGCCVWIGSWVELVVAHVRFLATTFVDV